MVDPETALSLLREVLPALNIAPRFRFHHQGLPTDSYTLAAKIERHLRERGIDPYRAPTPPGT